MLMAKSILPFALEVTRVLLIKAVLSATVSFLVFSVISTSATIESALALVGSH